MCPSGQQKSLAQLLKSNSYETDYRTPKPDNEQHHRVRKAHMQYTQTKANEAITPESSSASPIKG